MRNLINYYYQLEPLEIHQTKDTYTFEIDDLKYQLKEITKEQVEIAYNIMNELYQKGIYTHKIVPTVTNELQIYYNQKQYVLLCFYKNMNEKVDLEKINYFKNSIQYFNFEKVINTSNWGKLWSEKIDYFEYQMNQFGIKYKKIRESFAYYIGLAEVGIALFNKYYKEGEKLTLSHKRIGINSTLYNLYDPFNLILDLNVRDTCEYLKSTYIKNKNTDLIDEYLKTNTLTEYEKIMFFIRMFYPSFYFDCFEQIIDEQLEEEEIEKVIKKTEDYHLLLKKIYLTLMPEVNLPYISWLR